MKKLLMPVMALLLIVQGSYLLAADDDGNIDDDGINIYDKQANTAALEHRWKDIYKLIDDGNIDVNKHHSLGGDQLITRAVELNNLEVVQELLDRGAEPNIQAKELPLMKASRRYIEIGDNMPIIQLLLDSGAAPAFLNIHGSSTFNYIGREVPFWEIGENSERKKELIELFKDVPPAGEYIKGSVG